LPPGRARLVTSPRFQRIEHERNKPVFSLVAALKAITTGFVPVTIKSGLRATISPRDIGITLVMPLGGIAFDDQIFVLRRNPVGEARRKNRAPTRCPHRFR